MITNSNLKRIREILLTNNNNEFDNTVSEDDESDSDSDYSAPETESDDTSTDECISEKDDSSDSYISDDNTNTNIQPKSIQKDGVTWSIRNSEEYGRRRAANIIKKKPGAVTAVDTIVDAFKLFFTNDISDAVVLQTNNYARRYFDQQNQRQNTAACHSKSIQWKEFDRVVLEAFIGLLIQAGVS